MGHQGSLQGFGRFGSHACFFFHFFSLFIVMLGCDVQGWRWLYHNSTRTTLSESTGGHAMPLIFTPPFNFAASIVKSMVCLQHNIDRKSKRVEVLVGMGHQGSLQGLVTLVPIFVYFFHLFPLFIIVLEYGVRGQKSIHLSNIWTLPANSTHARERSIRRS
ncbi:hypothetical protein B0O80DRAFT_246252 [Mortierella sp. GBAus27b]|nr:hypothetical protein B0O80DRAFT_246252 [Mortierella sp. GBAus27b]